MPSLRANSALSLNVARNIPMGWEQFPGAGGRARETIEGEQEGDRRRKRGAQARPAALQKQAQVA